MWRRRAIGDAAIRAIQSELDMMETLLRRRSETFLRIANIEAAVERPKPGTG
jgi:hypothetical protein